MLITLRLPCKVFCKVLVWVGFDYDYDYDYDYYATLHYSAYLKRRQVIDKKFNTQLRIVCSTTGLLSVSPV